MSKQLQDLIRSTPLPPLHYVLCIMCVVKSHMHTLSHWSHGVHAESLLHNHVQIRHVLSCIIHGIVLYRTIKIMTVAILGEKEKVTHGSNHLWEKEKMRKIYKIYYFMCSTLAARAHHSLSQSR